ncbi:peptidase inhibitor family I36 protein [Streptomyces sp. NPDC029003]|uniref:peptidase inhibitor family I36 protein n=1 Tax=Streptomyces sp. NPDC029003 TaxID=3155125 RepID=UPI00340C716A
MRTWTTARATTLAAALLAATALIPATATGAHATGAHATGAHATGARAAAAPACATGELCLWTKPDFKGTKQTYDLSTLSINSCTALPAGTYQSLINRTGRPVTTYQSDVCAETGEFQTYPGDGVLLPQSPYQVRAFKVWET